MQFSFQIRSILLASIMRSSSREVSKKCAIISSYTPQAGDLRTDTVSADDETETFEKYEIYLRMLGLDPDNLPEKAIHSEKRLRILKRMSKINLSTSLQI